MLMIKNALEKQYDKCLDIMAQAIKDYPENLWDDRFGYKYPAWQIAYHALFYGNIYCSVDEHSITARPKQKELYEVFGKTPWPPFVEVQITESFSKSDILEFLEFVRLNVKKNLPLMKPVEQCWPSWYNENQLEFHINNLRHIQHHCGEMIERADIVNTFKYDWR